MIYMNTPGKRLRCLRISQNLTQMELAEKLDIPNYYLCRIETDQKELHSPLTEKCAAFFHISPSFLLTGNNPPDFLSRISDTPGKRLRTIRLENNMSQKELSGILGISSQQISNYEKDLVPITKKTAALLESRLGVSSDRLLYGKGSQSPSSNYLYRISNELKSLDSSELFQVLDFSQQLKKE